MTRISKPYDERHAEFLNVAQEFFFRKGYERTSVQEIIDTMGVAKGTFYYYFASKADLLDALVQHMAEQIVESLKPTMADQTLSAVMKLEKFFHQLESWKLANQDFLLDLLRALYRDDNVLLRIKMKRQAAILAAPLLSEIIREGVEEGVFSITSPDETAEIVILMGQALSDEVSALLIAGAHDDDAMAHLERKVLIYNRSVERVLGLPQDSLNLVEQDWLPLGG
jgi:AcrR family transcriptional regulator